MTKEKLKEEFFSFQTTISDNGSIIIKGSPMDVWNYFEPYLKLKSTKPKIEIPQFAVVKYNEMFPKIKSKKTGKYLRCNITEVSKSFERFFKDYRYEWNTIFEATNLYIQEEETKNYEWTVRSKYFVSKLKDSTIVSELAEYCDRVMNGEDLEEEQKGFDVKIY